MFHSRNYAEQLFPLTGSYALWVPEPPNNLCDEYKQTGVRVGDVGVITDTGAFDFIFNICEPDDHPINRCGVPDDFEPLSVNSDHIRACDLYQPGDCVSSVDTESSLIQGQISTPDNPLIPAGASACFEVRTTSKTGAILLLPDGATNYDLTNRALFRDYANRHAVRWYKFVNGTLGREVDNGSLYLITGMDKASAWGVASFSNISARQGLSLKLTAFQLASAGLSYGWEWERYRPAATRSWPRRNCHVSHKNENQSVFIRGFKVGISNNIVRLIAGKVQLSRHVVAKVEDLKESNPRDIFRDTTKGDKPYTGYKRSRSSQGSSQDAPSEGVNDGSSVTLEDVSSGSKVYHPSNAIINHILENNPSARVVVIHDEECAQLMTLETKMPSDEELIRRFSQTYQVDVRSDHGEVYFSPHDERSSANGILPRPSDLDNMSRFVHESGPIISSAYPGALLSQRTFALSRRMPFIAKHRNTAVAASLNQKAPEHQLLYDPAFKRRPIERVATGPKLGEDCTQMPQIPARFPVHEEYKRRSDWQDRVDTFKRQVPEQDKRGDPTISAGRSPHPQQILQRVQDHIKRIQRLMTELESVGQSASKDPAAHKPAKVHMEDAREKLAEFSTFIKMGVSQTMDRPAHPQHGIHKSL